jgi:methionyl aminopeptidase
VDITSIVNGWYGDQSETFLIGEVSASARRLVQTTFDSLFIGIRALRPGCMVTDIGRAIQTFAAAAGYSVVREYQGHGIGRDFHQEPGIPHFPQPASNRDLLRPGTCFTIEPMLNMGTWETRLDKKDKWTVRTRDGALSAQFEHTILMTETGPEILTLTQDGPREGHRF